MITWDSIVTGLVIGIIAGIGQAIGTWFIMKLVLKRIDQRTEQIEHAVEELNLTPKQKSEFAQKLGSASVSYVHEYGKALKEAFLWWKK